MKLDAVDLRILAELQQDGSLSNVELARRIHLSPSPCLMRVKALQTAGVIQRYVALTDPKAVIGLEARVTPEGFVPGWFSVQDISFVCSTVYCEVRAVMPWRGRPGLEALYDRYRDRPSMLATEINSLPPIRPRYLIERRPAG